MMRIVREDILTTHFRINWSHATNRIAEISTERLCLSKKRHKRKETKMNFVDHFLTPPF